MGLLNDELVEPFLCDQWWVPGTIRVEDGMLRWSWDGGRARHAPGPRLLADFLGLVVLKDRRRVSERVVSIAATSGPLTLCSSPSHGYYHPLPRGLAPDRVQGGTPVPLSARPDPSEAIESWLDLARAMAAAWRLGVALREERAGSDQDWLALGAPDAAAVRAAQHKLGRALVPPTLSAQSLAASEDPQPGRLLLAGYMTGLARHGHVGLEMTWTDKEPLAQPEAKCLEGALAIRLMYAVLGGQRPCSKFCGRAASQKDHSARPICSTCNAAGRAARSYQRLRDQRRRQA